MISKIGNDAGFRVCRYERVQTNDEPEQHSVV